MRRLHLIVGWFFAALFTASGLYMRTQFPEAYHGDSGVRMMYRASHVYMLLGALLNLAVAIGDRVPTRRAALDLQSLSSVCVMLAPFSFALSFWFEADVGRVYRPLAQLGTGFAVVGIAGLLWSCRNSYRD